MCIEADGRVRSLERCWHDQAVRGLRNEDSTLPSISLAQVRDEFPIAAERVYLNNASIAPLSTLVVAAVQAFLHDVRDRGRTNYPSWCAYAETAIKGRIGQLIGAVPTELAFVKNTTEGLVAVANGLDWCEGDNIVLPSFEYPSNVYCWQRLAKRGVAIKWVQPEAGRITVDALEQAIDRHTRLVSISAVQFTNGFRHELAETARMCRRRGVLLNVDAIQWSGALALDLHEIEVDFLSFGGHKWMMAPIGTGVFYCSQRSLQLLEPASVGYHSVAKSEAHLDYDLQAWRPGAARFEAALENFPGIWGLDAAVKVALGLGSKAIERHILDLTAHAAEGLQRLGWTVMSPLGPGERSGLLSFCAPGIDPAALEMQMRAAKIDLAVRDGRIRISPSYYNDHSDIDRLLVALPRV
jgi:selenocysteine lyase/cysteine desulfurase